MRFWNKSLLLAGLLLFGLSQLVAAETVMDLTKSLSVKSYSKKSVIIQKIAQTGDPQATVILQSLLDGSLFLTKDAGLPVLAAKLGKEYALSDPFTGVDLGQVRKRALKKIRINNKVRGILKASIARLNLSHPNPRHRIKAAKLLFKNLDKALLAPLQQLVEAENEGAVKEAFETTNAALILLHGDTIDARLKAVERLKAAGGPDVRALLSSMDRKLQAKASSDEQSEKLQLVVQSALKSVERQLENYGLIESLFQGISLSSVLLLAAIGLAITFGVMGVINMAHGEMVMIGAYTTYVIQEICRTSFPGFFDYSLILAIPMAFIVSGICGVIIERSVIRFLYGRPLETLLATWGISLLLQQLVRTIFGATNKEVGSPEWLSGAWEVTAGLSFTYNRIAIIFFALFVLAGLMLVLKKTLFGLQMRAVTQNRQMARSMGIKSARIDAMTFGLGSGVAGMAGVALSQVDNVSPNLGQAYIIDSFMVVVFGGVGNLWGTLVGASSLGIVNKFLEPYSGAVLAKIFVLVAIILFIQKRPRGLFALKGRSVEG
ncbi:MAG: urea ABC transporter permease subunit UrtB [Sneathiella sp.]|nr:urea ABC transporter permease subunit UrtB [Sneathiella sp.]